MAKTVNDGLARLQSESRISASTWRQWCTLLKIDPTDAVDVWEEICYPVMLASRRVPDVPFILQLRAARPELDVFDLKEEVPKILHFASFLSGLHDQRLTAGKVKSSLLAYYRLLAAGPAGRRPSPAFLRLLLVDLCSALLVSKILPAATITFSGVLKPVVEGKGSLEQVVRLGLRAVSSAPYGAVVRDSLGPSADAARQEALAFTPDSLRRSAVKEDEEDEEKERGTEDQDNGEDDEAYERGGCVPADDADADRDEAEADQKEGDEEDEGEDRTPARAEDETDREDTEAEGETDDDDQDEESEEGDENEEVRDGADEDDEDDDHDQNDPDDRERDDEAEEAEPAASRIEVFLLRFKTALHAVYEAEAKAAGAEEQEQAETLLEDRLRAITLFRPLVAAIPSLEEAQAVVRRAETKTRVVRTHRAVLGARPAAPSGSAGGGGAAPARPAAAADRPAVVAKGEPARRPPPPVTAPRPVTSANTKTSSLGAGGQVEVAIADMVEPERLTMGDTNEKAHQIGRLLAAIEPLDQTVWGLFLDPAVSLKDARGLARLLASTNSPAARAGQGLRQIASLQSLQDLVRLPDQLVRKDRSFMVEISTFVNGINNNRVFEADSRQLSPLKRILDHAVGALYRLEVLRINLRYWREHPDDYTAEAVTAYCEEALRLVTDQWNPELRRQIRQKADGDTTTMLQTFAAERFIEQLVEAARVYARELKENGLTRSLDELRLAMASRPLALPAVEAPPASLGEVPAELLVSLGLGEVLDELSRSVIAQVWPLMQPMHQPANTARRIQGVLRESLASSLVLSPERKRHYETPHIAMPVASLDKITGYPALISHYVRLRDDGRVAYLEGFEDGTYVDVFELREHKPMYGPSVPEKVEKEGLPEEEADEAPIGDRPARRKYLFTVGRTQKLFAATPSDLINGCIRGTGGGPRIWPRVVGGRNPK